MAKPTYKAKKLVQPAPEALKLVIALTGVFTRIVAIVITLFSRAK